VFLSFLAGVSVRGAGRPMILKSPTHGTRVDTLRELLPDARYILIVRDPLTNFESVVRMWRKMFETYALSPIPAGDGFREAVLADRPRFKAKLTANTSALPENRFIAITYEALVANPVTEVERLYAQLELGDFGGLRESVKPSGAWQLSRPGQSAIGCLEAANCHGLSYRYHPTRVPSVANDRP